MVLAVRGMLRKLWPKLSPKNASAEVVAAIAYESTHFTVCFWNGVGGRG